MMRTAGTAILVVVVAGLGGCQWLDSRVGWPWRKKSVPVTRSKWTASSDRPEGKAQTQPAEPANPPGGEPQSTPKTGPVGKPHKLPATKPATAPDESLKVVGRPLEVTTSVLFVKDESITVEEILQAVAPRLEAVPDGMAEHSFRNAASRIISQEVARQINDVLVLDEAKGRLGEEHKKHVENEVQAARRRMIAEAGGSAKKLQLVLADKGTTLDEVLDTHRRTLTVQLYLQVKFLPAIGVNRKMLLEYYRAHIDDFRKDKKVAMQIIAAPFKAYLAEGVGGTPSETERAAAKHAAALMINKAGERLNAGEDFAKVARELSRGIKAEAGGLWPKMSAGSFREVEVEKAAFALKPGDAQGVIETKIGYYIVKATEVADGGVVPFEEAQEGIEEILRNRQFERLISNFQQRLQAKAGVRQDREFINSAVDRAVQLYWKL
ncbi:MAG: peptidyl-prolyl cis-trans isomerase [Phycisphaerae bacterium]|jgi:hypothetical protein|nr:peptidyl-prolyl cis-trans isomerase [Phycisphaerae bacterium]